MQGSFCSHCGQPNKNLKKALRPLLSEVLRETFDADGRLIRTTKLLFSKPGLLATEFSANRRAAYMSPFRLYLFSSLLFFFLTQVFSDGITPDTTVATNTEPRIAEVVVSDPVVQQFKAKVSPELHAEVDAVLQRDNAASRTLKQLIVASTQESGFLSDATPTVQFALDQAIKLFHDPNGLVDGFLQNTPLAMVFLLPAFALLLTLIFRRPKRYFIEHLVFALHLHAAAFLLFIPLAPIPQSVFNTVPGDLLETSFYLFFAIHSYFALRRYYDHSPGNTFMRFLVLGIAYSVLMIPTLLGIGLMTFITL
jgi:hypothetical protein